MEPVNTSGKRRRGRRKNGERPQTGPSMVPPAGGSLLEGTQGVSSLHSACLSGHVSAVRLLLESSDVNSSDVQGLRPVHMVLTSRSSPNTSSCLLLLLEHGARVNVYSAFPPGGWNTDSDNGDGDNDDVFLCFTTRATHSGATPLHMAASEGFLACTEILVHAGADVSAEDGMGHTPLDLARIWCRRDVARFLKSCTWWTEKKKETQDRKLVQEFYRDLVERVKLNELNKKALIDEKMAEWASKKGLPVPKRPSPRVASLSQRHTECLPSLQKPKNTTKQRSGSPEDPSSRPRTPRDPDLRDQVVLRRGGGAGGGGRPHYTTTWDATRRPAPDVPLDVLERALFPRAFPSRIPSPGHFEPRDVDVVQQRGHPQGRSSSPWTEVAMHLAEELQPGHY